MVQKFNTVLNRQAAGKASLRWQFTNRIASPQWGLMTWLVIFVQFLVFIGMTTVGALQPTPAMIQTVAQQAGLGQQWPNLATQLSRVGAQVWGSPATAAAQAPSPGGVAAGLRFWVRADSGVSTITPGAAVAQWNDQSGNSFHLMQPTASQQPTYEIGGERTNYNPALRFNDDFLRNTSRILQITDGMTMIGVGDSDVTGGIRSLISMGNDYNDPTIALFGTSILPWFDGGGTANVFTNETLPTQKPLLWALRGDNSVSNGMRFAYQGQDIPLNMTVAKQTYYGQNVGLGGDGFAEDWQGLVYEGIIYSRKLTVVEQQRVNSYLALKYGVTLRPVDSDATIIEGDYLAANGTTANSTLKVWDYTANRTYHNNVAGIGRDDASALNQKQSRSVNDGFQPVIGLGTIAVNNAANPSTFTADKSYLIWGSDTGAITFGTAYTPNSFTPSIPSYYRLTRVWKVQETGQVGPVSVQARDGQHLLVSTDPTFARGVREIPLSGSSATVDFVNGEYFTFGSALTAPGGVVNGLRFWVRADSGVSTTSAGAAVAQWNDQSGNGFHLTQSTPAQQPTYEAGLARTNYNPALRFNDDFLRNTSRILQTTDGMTMMGVGNSDVTGGIRSLIAMGDNYNDPAIDLYGTSILARFDGGGLANVFTNETLPTQKPLLWGVRGDNSVNNGVRFTYQGQDIPLNMTVAKQTYYGQNVGLGGDGGGEDWQGLVHEGIIYNRKLASVEQQRVHSYLALKYGVTLRPVDSDATIIEGDYLAANGTTANSTLKVWDYTANRAYHNNVAGIGRDDASALNQKQSRSVNDGFQPVIGLGDIAATNGANPSTFAADKSYLVWGSDNGATNFGIAYTPSSFTPSILSYYRMSRVWKVQETGVVETVSVQGPAIANLLLVSNDPTFSTGVTEIPLTSGRGAYNFTSGQYFTFGAEDTLTAGNYRLALMHSMKCLNVTGTVNSATVTQEACGFSTKGQQWQITAVSGGVYKLANRNSGKLMEVTGGSTADRTNIAQNDDRNGTHQQWRFVLQEDGSYQLVAIHSNKCAGIYGASMNNGANLEQVACLLTPSQRIVVLPLQLAAEGLYTVTALGSGQCLEVAGAGLNISANIQQGSCDPTAVHQQWYLSLVGDGLYKLINRNSGKVMEVAGGSTADSANLQQYDYVAGSNQKWQVTAHRDGSYQLVAVHSNKCADVVAGSTASGANLQQAPCTINANQRFTLSPLGLVTEGLYTISALHSGQCLEVAGANPNAGATVQQGLCNAMARHQQWQLLAVGDGYYRLVNFNSGKLLEIADNNMADGAMVRQSDYLNNNNQLWKIIVQGDGTYQLRAVHSNKCVDIAGAATTPGASLQQAACTTAANQRFTLTAVELLPESAYTIKAVHSGKCVEIAGASGAAGSQVQQNSCNPALKEQQWQPVALGSGYYKLVNLNSGKVLAVPGGNVNSLVDLAQEDDSGLKSQQWRLVAQGGGAYLLIAAHSNKCADVYGAAQADGTRLVQQDCGTGTNQRFYFLSIAQPAEAVYAVKGGHSGKCMTVADASLDSGATVQQWNCAATTKAQQWQFVIQASGNYKLVNRNSGKVLEVAAGSLNDGVNLQQGDDTGASYQQWQLVAQTDGTYQLVALHSNRCIEVADGSTTEGAQLRQNFCGTAPQQRFQLLPTGLGSQRVAEGLYTMQLVHSDKCLDLAGASQSNGAPVQQWNCNSTQKSKQWQLVALGGDNYKVVNVNSGKVLEVAGGSTADGANVQQGDETGGNHQKWKLVGAGDGSYQLVAAHSNKCVEVVDAAPFDGANLRQTACSTGSNQRIRLFPAALVAKSLYLLQALHRGNCVEVAGANLSNGGKVQQGSCDRTAKYQQWRLFPLGNSYYKVVNFNSNKVLEIAGSNTADGANLQQWDDYGGAQQQWKLVPQVDGSYQLMALHSNKCIDVTSATATVGAPLTQLACGAVTTQRFNLVPVGEPTVTDFEDNSLDIFTNGNGSALTSEARSGQRAAAAIATGSTVAHRDLISPQIPVVASAWVKGVGTAYLLFVGSDALEISHTAQAVKSTTWQRIVFAATAPPGAAYYDLVFRADNGAFLVDNVVVLVNEPDTDGDGLSDRIETCRNLGSVNYEFYDGAVAGATLKNLPVSGALGQGVVTNFDSRALQSQFTPQDPSDYGVRYSGYLWIAEEGVYTFFTNSAAGSQLWINQRLVVNNDGLHGLTERSGTVHLYAGIHRFHLLYSAYGSANTLAAVQWSGPAFGKVALPFNRLLSCDLNLDSDQDGLPNYRDLDSDDDTIPDALEDSQ